VRGPTSRLAPQRGERPPSGAHRSVGEGSTDVRPEHALHPLPQLWRQRGSQSSRPPAVAEITAALRGLDSRMEHRIWPGRKIRDR
jgi:hypothetical protein